MNADWQKCPYFDNTYRWVWEDGPFEVYVYKDKQGGWRGGWYPRDRADLHLKSSNTLEEAQRDLAKCYAEYLEEDIAIMQTTLGVMRDFIKEKER